MADVETQDDLSQRIDDLAEQAAAAHAAVLAAQDQQAKPTQQRNLAALILKEHGEDPPDLWREMGVSRTVWYGTIKPSAPTTLPPTSHAKARKDFESSIKTLNRLRSEEVEHAKERRRAVRALYDALAEERTETLTWVLEGFGERSGVRGPDLAADLDLDTSELTSLLRTYGIGMQADAAIRNGKSVRGYVRADVEAALDDDGNTRSRVKAATGFVWPVVKADLAAADDDAEDDGAEWVSYGEMASRLKAGEGKLRARLDGARRAGLETPRVRVVRSSVAEIDAVTTTKWWEAGLYGWVSGTELAEHIAAKYGQDITYHQVANWWRRQEDAGTPLMSDTVLGRVAYEPSDALRRWKATH
ncbi:hypothetical protein ACQP25_44860 (plasmid) [Microtetraspora malaysiensis]|uniref:hypothetical protein n=1 Tax=Microtetraspora malaysiensis TaxID=161358 RepID=UPI003D902B9E